MKVKDLKEHLQDIINELEDYNEEEEVVVVSNTYFLKDKTNFLATQKGFIDLSNPIELEDCEWCGDTYGKKELIKARDKNGKLFGCLCQNCFQYLLTKGEELVEDKEN